MLKAKLGRTAHQVIDLVVRLVDGVDIPGGSFKRGIDAANEFVRLKLVPAALASLQYLQSFSRITMLHPSEETVNHRYRFEALGLSAAMKGKILGRGAHDMGEGGHDTASFILCLPHHGFYHPGRPAGLFSSHQVRFELLEDVVDIIKARS